MKHTKGPWKLSKNKEFIGPELFTPRQATKADIRLVQAAPEMLEACEMALEYMQQVVRLDSSKSAAKNQIKWLESAIRKARGAK
jgi:hypothetical protein